MMRTETPLISCIINADTRSGFLDDSSQQTGLFNGCISEDFLTEGLYNRKKFLDGFDAEFIMFIDEHEPIPEKTLNYLIQNTDCLVIRKHTHEDRFNEMNYISALMLARGKYIFHVDQDCATFTNNKENVQEYIDLLEKYDYVSYPSLWSPKGSDDPAYDYVWCSTRYYWCKRETLDFTEILKCEKDYEYTYNQYPASVKNPWLEHYLGLISKYTTGRGVYYPPVDYSKTCIFVWDNYNKYTWGRLNTQSYDEVKNWVLSMGGIHWPNNLTIR